MNLFIPDVAYIYPRSLKYVSAKTTIEYSEKLNVPLIHSRKVVLESNSPVKNYGKAKRTVFITVNSENHSLS